jgi:hypothetical protein
MFFREYTLVGARPAVYICYYEKTCNMFVKLKSASYGCHVSWILLYSLYCKGNLSTPLPFFHAVKIS